MTALALAESARNQAAAHPLWHYLVVAGVAVCVFLGIKVKEFRDQRRSRRGDAPRARPLSHGFAAPTVSTIVLVAASVLSGGIHGSVTGEHFGEAFVFGVFFLGSAAAQVAWAILFAYRPTRALLVAGAVGNAAVIAVWSMSRTVGIPFGPEPWHAEPVGAIDVICTVLELVIVVTAVVVLARRGPCSREGVVERRLDALRKDHPTLVRPAGLRTPTSGEARQLSRGDGTSTVAGAEARVGLLLYEEARGGERGIAPAPVEREGSCDVAQDDIVGEAVLQQHPGVHDGRRV